MDEYLLYCANFNIIIIKIKNISITSKVSFVGTPSHQLFNIFYLVFQLFIVKVAIYHLLNHCQKQDTPEIFFCHLYYSIYHINYYCFTFCSFHYCWTSWGDEQCTRTTNIIFDALLVLSQYLNVCNYIKDE